MITIEPCGLEEQWNSEVLDRQGHPLQLWGWGEVKTKGSWRVDRVFIRENDEIIGLCQLLLRPLPAPFRTLVYAPRGPVVRADKREVVVNALASYVKKHYQAVSIVLEPDWEEGYSVAGWQQSPNPILIARTVVLDLLRTTEELLGQMSKKTRQYIRKSEKEGIEIRQAKSLNDVDQSLALYKETAKRVGFALHGDHYYRDIFTHMGSHSQIFMAVYQGRVLAFLWLAVSEETAFELYGGMNDEGQELRANYILKWTAIQRCKEWGIRRYDMNGLLNDGVSKFKQGFTDHETILAGSFEKPLSVWYPLWAKGLPAAKKLIRTIKR